MTKILATVSSKRQITLPAELCRAVDIAPGDKIEVFLHDGQITVVKKQSGTAKGVLKHLAANQAVSDKASLLDALGRRQTGRAS